MRNQLEENLGRALTLCTLLLLLLPAVTEAACPASISGASVRLRLQSNGAVVNCVNPSTSYVLETFGSSNNVAYCITDPPWPVAVPLKTIGFNVTSNTCLDAGNGDIVWPRGFVLRTHSSLPSFGIAGVVSPACSSGSSGPLLFEEEFAFSYPRCSPGGSTCLTPPSNDVAWYTFDESSGTVVNDSAGNNDGTRYGASSTANGRARRALDFDGSNDYVGVPDSSTLDFGTGDFSLEGWIKTTDSSAMIASKRVYTGGKHVGYLFMVYNGRLLLQIGDSTNSWANYLSTTSVNNGQWRHVAVTVDRDIPTGGRFFVDGALVNTFNPRGRSGNTSNSAAFEIGRTTGGGSYFDGVIDELSLYNRVLSASEILAIFRAGGGGKCKPALPVPLRVSLNCATFGESYHSCNASATGGSGGYTYTWNYFGSGSMSSNGNSATVNLSCPSSPGGTISVTAVDSSGAAAGAFEAINCNTCGGRFCEE